MVNDLKRMRLLCGLRQIDVSFCTGVSVSALAAAEHGRKPLNHIEHGLVIAYLNARWKFLQELEGQKPVPHEARSVAALGVSVGT